VPPKRWNTLRAVKIGIIIGLLLTPVSLLLHQEDIRCWISLYQRGDSGTLAGDIVGYILGSCIAVALPIVVICAVRNLFVMRRRPAR